MGPGAAPISRSLDEAWITTDGSGSVTYTVGGSGEVAGTRTKLTELDTLNP